MVAHLVMDLQVSATAKKGEEVWVECPHGAVRVRGHAAAPEGFYMRDGTDMPRCTRPDCVRKSLRWYNVEMREVLEGQRPSEWIAPDHNEKLPYATMAEWRAGDHGEPNWSRLDMLLSDYVYELMWDECRGSDTPFGKSPDRKELRRRVQEARELSRPTLH